MSYLKLHYHKCVNLHQTFYDELFFKLEEFFGVKIIHKKVREMEYDENIQSYFNKYFKKSDIMLISDNNYCNNLIKYRKNRLVYFHDFCLEKNDNTFLSNLKFSLNNSDFVFNGILPLNYIVYSLKISKFLYVINDYVYVKYFPEANKFAVFYPTKIGDISPILDCLKFLC